MKVRRLTRHEARRIAIRAQLLDAHRPTDLAAVADRLTFLQLDPTAAIAPSADLVAWTRLGKHQDVPFTRATTAAVRAELAALAEWPGLDHVRYV